MTCIEKKQNVESGWNILALFFYERLYVKMKIDLNSMKLLV